MLASQLRSRGSAAWIAGLLALVQIMLIFALKFWFWDFSSPAPLPLCTSSQALTIPANAIGGEASISSLLNGRPSASFKDNLRTDIQYITTWPANGWSNQVIEFMNLLYVARITGRVPIIPRFRPVHINRSVEHLDFGSVFDVRRLQSALGQHILEWNQVKDPHSETIDELGCWDIQDKTWEREPVYLEPPVDLKLDISYTAAPKWVRTEDSEPTTLLWHVASLASFYNGGKSLSAPVLSPLHEVSLPPDTHLFCCNSLYWGLGLLDTAEDVSPAWQSVGRHMHWTPQVIEMATASTRQTLNLAPHDPIPPYLAVHIRRGDFRIWCNIDGVPVTICFAPLSAFVRRIEEVRSEILNRTGTAVSSVIVTSDETAPEWWESVYELGWRRPDHSKTVEMHGPWYPVVIDAAIHGGALGFVGTDTSTVSILARRRVIDKGGVAEMVKWGRPGADAHRRAL
ncbi:hypothetical protein C8R43DRAFT_967324 [Mycena crocata]|nr:hypothetical protein C8R43DRAFT_967324 [Mycena crocata]